MPEIYMIIAQKYIFPIFWVGEGEAPLTSRLLYAAYVP